MASLYPSSTSAAQSAGGLESLVAEVNKLVSLPDIYYRLEETIVDPTSTMEVIANLLRSDPDLCARMLRMANSAFYSSRASAGYRCSQGIRRHTTGHGKHGDVLGAQHCSRDHGT